MSASAMFADDSIAQGSVHRLCQARIFNKNIQKTKLDVISLKKEKHDEDNK